MSPSEALLYFTLQVTKAEHDLKMTGPPAKVIVMDFNAAYEMYQGKLNPQTAAMVMPCAPGTECDPTIVVMQDEINNPRPYRLQCIARHEVSHIALGHLYGTRSYPEEKRQHQAVYYIMKWTWHQDSTCREVWSR